MDLGYSNVFCAPDFCGRSSWGKWWNKCGHISIPIMPRGAAGTLIARRPNQPGRILSGGLIPD